MVRTTRRVPEFGEPARAILRGALFPKSSLRALTGESAALQALSRPDVVLADAIEADLQFARVHISRWLKRDDVAEALFVASASASDGADAAAMGKPSALRGPKLGRFYRYASRFAGRPTPFGMSSGYALVSCGATTSLELAQTVLRHTRIDAVYVQSVWDLVAPSLKNKCYYRTNATLYQAAERYSMLTRYADQASGAPGYSTVELERSTALDRVVDIARSTPCAYARLVEAAIGGGADGSWTVGEQFIDELIDAQVLHCIEAPCAVGPTLLEQLESALHTAVTPEATDLLAVIADAKAELERWDRAQRPVSKSAYLTLRDRLMRQAPRANPACVFHVDARLALSSGQLDRRMVARLVDAAVTMAAIVGPPWMGEMRRFRDRFEARYGRQSVPLLRLFDPQEGIGFQRQDRDSDLVARRYARVFARCRTDNDEVVLSDEDVAALALHSELVPDAFSIHATLLAQNTPEAPFAVLHGIRGPSCAWAAGRFCHGDDQLREVLESHIRAEERLRPDVVFAEIVHLPSARAGNFTARPKLRSHWVRLFSGGSDSEEILLADLDVFVNDRVRLWSRRLNKEVVLRHSCALDLNAGHELFAFLQAVEAEGTTCRAVFDLGAFTPRIRLGGVILQPASWTMDAAEAHTLLEGSACARYRGLQTFRQLYGVPRWVRVGLHDQAILVDLDHPLGCDEALRLLSASPGTHMFEAIEDLEEGVLRGVNGAHAHELVIPVVRSVTRCATASLRPPAPRTTSGQRFFPGSDWLAAHIYCAPHVAEQMLTEQMTSLVARSRESRGLRRWFFSRSTDLEFHLRIRLLMASEADHAAMLRQLHALLAPQLASGSVWRMCVDTYDREVERYGGLESIEIAERMFEIDSDFVAAALASFRNDEDRSARWNATLLGIHQMVQAFELEPAARAELLRRCRVAWAPRGDAAAEVERGARATFQDRRDELLQMLRQDTAVMVDPELWADRLGQMQVAARKLLTMHGNTTTEGILESLLHMHVNRVFAPDGDFGEFRLYDALSRVYRLDVGRRTAGQPPALS